VQLQLRIMASLDCSVIHLKTKKSADISSSCSSSSSSSPIFPRESSIQEFARQLVHTSPNTHTNMLFYHPHDGKYGTAFLSSDWPFSSVYARHAALMHFGIPLPITRNPVVRASGSFVIDGCWFSCIEHYIHYIRFKPFDYPHALRILEDGRDPDNARDMCSVKAYVAHSTYRRQSDCLLMHHMALMYQTSEEFEEQLYQGVRAKFFQNEELLDALLLTGKADMVCSLQNKYLALDKALLRVRDDLLSVSSSTSTSPMALLEEEEPDYSMMLDLSTVYPLEKKQEVPMFLYCEDESIYSM
jgi:predicted NAD-dependent protein-ADP-ribosyltransferase YbiA (DUF1768 family)